MSFGAKFDLPEGHLSRENRLEDRAPIMRHRTLLTTVVCGLTVGLGLAISVHAQQAMPALSNEITTSSKSEHWRGCFASTFGPAIRSARNTTATTSASLVRRGVVVRCAPGRALGSGTSIDSISFVSYVRRVHAKRDSRGGKGRIDRDVHLVV